MAHVIDIPGGQATFRDPKVIRERHRRILRAATLAVGMLYDRLPGDLRDSAVGDSESAEAARQTIGRLLPAVAQTLQERMALSQFVDSIIIALLESWSLPKPLPDIETIQDLDTELYDALAEGVTPFTQRVMESVVPPDFATPSRSPESPFGSSESSAKRSRSDSAPTPKLMKAPTTTGASTDIADTSVA